MSFLNDKYLAERYSRHLVIPEVGEEGQEKLLASSVLIIGAGGLGSPALLYLAAAGVGTIGILDNDNVSLSNLQRQILYNDGDMGLSKTETAARRIEALNKSIKVKTHNVRITSENALEIIKAYDVVIDGTDNFVTRYLINDACVLMRKPNVYGSILRFSGQASVFIPFEGPCYRCLYPSPPVPGTIPSCDEAGVVGVIPGIIGSIQAAEAIKIILGKGELLKGRLLLLDGLDMKFRELNFSRDPGCPVCGDKPVIKELIDYEEFCNIKIKPNRMNEEITVQELKEKIDKKEDIILLDVREPFEKSISDIGGVLIPLNSLPEKFNELDSTKEIIVYCRTGNRSYYAMKFLKEQCNFPNVKNLTGGIYAWSNDIDPKVQKY